MTVTVSAQNFDLEQNAPELVLQPAYTAFSGRDRVALPKWDRNLQPKILVVIDAGVDEVEMLAAGVVLGAEVVVLQPDHDGIEQITEALKRYPQATCLHLVAHGAPGCVRLGNSQLSLETIESYATRLQAWSARSIQIYACQVAVGDAGAEFMQRLHQLTGAAIAAATKAIGQAQGGTWRLDALTPSWSDRPASCPFEPATLAAYPGTLAIEPVGSYYGSRSVVLAGTVAGNYVYLADNEGGLPIIDVSNPSNPVRVGLYEDGFDSNYDTDGIDGEVFHATVVGSYAYLANGTAGIDIVDVSDPSNPTKLGSYQTPNEAFRIAIADNLAYIADRRGLRIVDVSSPASPVAVGEFNTRTTDAKYDATFGVVIAGNYAYLADGSQGIQVIDISTPSSPQLVRTISTGGIAYGIAIAEDLLYIANGNAGVQIFSLSDPGSPLLTGSIDTNSIAYSVAVAGQYAYVADFEDGLQVLDISDPGSPVLTGSIDTDGFAFGVDVTGNYVYVADGRNGLQIFGLGVKNVSATANNGSYKAGDTIDITVTFEEAVTVTGAPQLKLETGAIDRAATYLDGSGSNTLTFRYTVQAGDNSLDLDFASTAALELNGGTIRYTANSNPAILALPIPGAAGSLGANQAIVIDTASPEPATAAPLLATESDTGQSASDRITTDRTLTFTGTGTAGDRVDLYSDSDSNMVGSATVDATGSWSIETSALPEGNHRIWSTFTDAVGNKSAKSAEVTVTIDTTKPIRPAAPDLAAVSDAGRSNTDNITNVTTPTFTGTGGAVGDTITLYAAASGSTKTAIGTGTVSSTGWSIALASPLADGVYDITATSTDLAGNESDASPALRVDIRTSIPTAPSTAPVLSALNDSGISNRDKLTNINTPILSGMAAAGNTIQVFAGNTILGSTIANSQGQWIFKPASALADGAYSIAYKALDVAGNASAFSPAETIAIDTQAAIATLTGVEPKLRESGVDSIALRFNEAVSNFDIADIVLTRNGQALSLEGATLTTTDRKTWTLNNLVGITQPQGNYQLSLKPGEIIDAAGNRLTNVPIETWATGYLGEALPTINFKGGKSGRQIKGGGLLLGSGDRDVLRGLGGRDYLWGRNGNDVLIGGRGNDKLRGGRRNDRLIGGGGNDNLRGGRGDDLLIGSEGNDRLVGRRGNDVIVGGIGKDNLLGNGNRDTFVYTDLQEAGDRIIDFTGEDLIDLRGIFKAAQFSGNSDFSRFSKYVELKQVGASTEVRIDRDGNGTAFTTLVTLENVAANSITSTNFVIS